MKKNSKGCSSNNLSRWLVMAIMLLAVQITIGHTTVTGNVSDTEGPLSGASVVVKGTTVGVSADFDGNYSIDVAEGNNILVFSYVGYTTQEIAIDSRSTINVSMEADAQALSEVVVVGYGTQRKADLTGSVGSVGSELIENKPITSADQVLAGTVAGVNITTRSGDAGAPINVRIRGTGTAGSNGPLWVIDGVPIVQTSNITVNTSSTTESNPLSGINPNDIESIDVLKDAASAAIYGARAANGVIIVTTKRGKKGSAKITYDGYGATASVRQTRDVLDVGQYISLQNQLGRDFSNFSGAANTDWQDAVYRDGFSQNHNLTVSGGSENANYFISGSYLDQEGVELGQSFERFAFKANSDIKVGKIFKFGESILISQTDRTVQGESAIFSGYNAALNAPFFPVRDGSSGLFGYAQESNANLNGVTGTARGLNLVARNDPRAQEVDITARKVLANFYGEIEFVKGLKLRPSLGIDFTAGYGDIQIKPVDLNGDGPQQDLFVSSRPNELTLTSAVTLGYDRTFGDHSLSFLAGFEQTKFRFDKQRIQGRELVNPNFPATGASVAAANEADLWAIQGFLGRLNYNYKGKYLLTANVRRDASSRFGDGFRSAVFPSVSAGWRISQEDFFNNEGAINDLKIRGSWGQNGNQDTPDSFPFLSALQTTIFYVIGDGQGAVNAPAPVRFANRSLTWETSTQLNFGLDASLFDRKLNLTVDYYDKTSDDVLIGLPISGTSGYFFPAQSNIGQIKNSGLELSFDYGDKIGDFSYNIGGNFTTNKNEVTDLGTIPQILAGIGGETHRTIVGESLGHFYGYKTDGLYQTDAEAAAGVPDAVSASRQAGDVRFVDVNGDGEVNADDRTLLGSPIPGFYYGMNLGAKYKGWDFSAILRGVGDIQIYNQARRGLESFNGAPFVTNAPNGSNNYSTSVLSAWNGAGSTNSSLNPRVVSGDPNSNERYSDRWVEDAGYLRIQNIQIGYSIPSEDLRSWTNDVVSRIRVYVSANNLATFTNYSGTDPEVTRAQNFQKGDFTLSTGQDGGATPQPRVIQVGLSMSFN